MRSGWKAMEVQGFKGVTCKMLEGVRGLAYGKEEGKKVGSGISGGGGGDGGENKPSTHTVPFHHFDACVVDEHAYYGQPGDATVFAFDGARRPFEGFGVGFRDQLKGIERHRGGSVTTNFELVDGEGPHANSNIRFTRRLFACRLFARHRNPLRAPLRRSSKVPKLLPPSRRKHRKQQQHHFVHTQQTIPSVQPRHSYCGRGWT